MVDERAGIDTSPAAIVAAGPFSEREMHLLRQVVEVLNELGITFWLDQGALLGIVRDGRLIPWDADIDLSVWDDDIRQVEPLLYERLCALEHARVVSTVRVLGVVSDPPGQYLTVSIHRHHRRGREAVKWLRRPPGARSPRWLVQRTVLSVGRVLVSKPGEKALAYRSRAAASGGEWPGSRLAGVLGRILLRVRVRAGNLLNEYSRPRFRMSVDARYFERLRPVIMGDLRLSAPADTEAYLELKYGPDWRIPRQEWTYWEEDGAVKRR